MTDDTRTVNSRCGVAALALLATALLGLAVAAPAHAGEVTGASDNLRTGWYPDEGTLEPPLLRSGRFKQVFSQKLSGQIYAQPLVANGTLLVVTETDMAYGLNPVTGEVRWERKLGQPVNSEAAPIKCPDLAPTIGVTGTPVIDTARNVAYFVANEVVEGKIFSRMHGLDLSSGNEVFGPVAIEGNSQNAISTEHVAFEPAHELQRPALLLMNGVVYAAFGGHCDEPPYHGWLVGVSTEGHVVTKWVTSNHGDSIWQGGGGLVSDGPGQILFTTGNAYKNEAGKWDPVPGDTAASAEAAGRLGESVVRVAVQPSGELKALDYFSPFESRFFDEEDTDLGSAAPVALPPQFGTARVPNLLVQEGKDGHVYVLDRKKLGGRENLKNNIVQELPEYGGVWGAAAVWPGDGGYVYVPAVSHSGSSTGGGGNHLGFFRYAPEGENPRFSTKPAESSEKFFFGSGSPIVTSNGVGSGSALSWITRCPSEPSAEVEVCTGAQLMAYEADAAPGSKPNAIWSAPIQKATKFARPGASNGHIYVGTSQGSSKTTSSGEIIGFSGPSLTASSQSLALGTVLVGAQASGHVIFTNTGTPLRINGVTATAPFTASAAPPVPSESSPGDAISVSVSFTSTTPGAFQGAVEVLTDAGTFSVPVSVVVTTPTPPPPETTTVAGLVVQPPPGPLLTGVEPVPGLTSIQFRPFASRLSSHRRKLAVSYIVSAAARVEAIVYRRVVSHRCAAGVSKCGRWAATHIRLKVSAHAGINRLTLQLGAISAGNYRLALTPLAPSGIRGVTQYLRFKTH